MVDEFDRELIKYIGSESDVVRFYSHNITETILYDNTIDEFMKSNSIIDEEHFVVYSFYIQAYLAVRDMFSYKYYARIHIKQILLKCSDELYKISRISHDEYVKFAEHANKLKLRNILDEDFF